MSKGSVFNILNKGVFMHILYMILIEFFFCSIVSDNGEINGTEEEFNEKHIKDMHEDPFVENIENTAFAHGANALIKYFKEHPELRYEDYISAEDIEEMQALLVE